jgi:hypothetical protein
VKLNPDDIKLVEAARKAIAEKHLAVQGATNTDTLMRALSELFRLSMNTSQLVREIEDRTRKTAIRKKESEPA